MYFPVTILRPFYRPYTLKKYTIFVIAYCTTVQFKTHLSNMAQLRDFVYFPVKSCKNRPVTHYYNNYVRVTHFKI